MTTNKYASRLAALAGAAVATSRAAAEIVAVSVNHTYDNIQFSTGGSFYFNPVGSQFSTSASVGTTNEALIFFSTSNFSVTPTNVSFVGGTQHLYNQDFSVVDQLAAGDSINSRSDFVTGASLSLRDFTVTHTTADYLGFSVANQGASHNQTWYGWVQLDTSSLSMNPYSYKVVAYAYETSGADITAGATSAIPEPGVTAMLFGGAALAVIAIRRLWQARRLSALPLSAETR